MKKNLQGETQKIGAPYKKIFSTLQFWTFGRFGAEKACFGIDLFYLLKYKLPYFYI
ncbi:MAG: hypothetical protein NC206_00465 [Bacteroides sp.]|nr:hypothetical protein [Roseburia sp.]MCM1345547.1 hypothetical protein [Bacteroides sp.]MCM1420378.1 hypothetical protein [Bacteroides sp.]